MADMTIVRILNGHLDALRVEEIPDIVNQRICEGQRGYLCTVNVAILMMMRKDLRLQASVAAGGVIKPGGPAGRNGPAFLSAVHPISFGEASSLHYLSQRDPQRRPVRRVADDYGAVRMAWQTSPRNRFWKR